MAKGKKDKKPSKQSGKPWKIAIKQKAGSKPAVSTVQSAVASQGFARCEDCGQNHSINALYVNDGKCTKLIEIVRCWRCEYVPPAGFSGKRCPSCDMGDIMPSSQYCNGRVVSTLGKQMVARAR